VEVEMQSLLMAWRCIGLLEELHFVAISSGRMVAAGAISPAALASQELGEEGHEIPFALSEMLPPSVARKSGK